MRWHLLPRITYSRSQLRQTPAVELSQMQLMRASGLKSTAYAHNDPSEKIFQPPFHPTGSALDGLIQMKDSYHDMPLCGPFIEKQHTAMTRAATTQKVPAAWFHPVRQSHISKNDETCRQSECYAPCHNLAAKLAPQEFFVSPQVHSKKSIPLHRRHR